MSSPLCKHAFYKGNKCPHCIEDELLLDLLREVITRFSYTTGLLVGVSNKYMDFAFTNMEIAKRVDAVILSLEKERT